MERHFDWGCVLAVILNTCFVPLCVIPTTLPSFFQFIVCICSHTHLHKHAHAHKNIHIPTRVLHPHTVSEQQLRWAKAEDNPLFLCLFGRLAELTWMGNELIRQFQDKVCIKDPLPYRPTVLKAGHPGYCLSFLVVIFCVCMCGC